MKGNDAIGISVAEIFIVIVFFFLLLLIFSRNSDEQTKQEYEELEERYQRLEEEDLGKNLKDIIQQIIDLEAKVSELTEENSEAERELAKQQETIDRLNELTEELTAKNEALEKENEKLKKENEQLAEEEKPLKDKVETLEQELSQLKRALVGFDPCWSRDQPPGYYFTYEADYNQSNENYLVKAIWQENRAPIIALRGNRNMRQDEKLLTDYPRNWISREVLIAFLKRVKASQISGNCKFVVKVPDTVPGKDIKAIRPYLEPVYY